MNEYLADKMNAVTDTGDVIVRDDVFESVHHESFDQSEYMVNYAVPSKDLVKFPESDASSQSDNKEQVEQVTTESKRPERLHQALEQNGFYPQNGPELVQVTALTSDAYPAGGAAHYLNDILLGRKKHESIKDPAKALRKIVRDWQGYAASSKVDIHFLRELQGTLSQEDLNPLTSIANLPSIRDWKYQESTHRAIGAIVRYKETEAFVEGKGPDYLGTAYVTDNKEVLAREAAIINGLRAGQTRGLIDTLVAQYQKRSEFWQARLEEADKHAAVRPIIRSVGKTALQ